MKASTKRILSIMVSAALMVTVIVIFIKLIKPAYLEVQKLRGEIGTRTNLLKEQTNAVAQVQNIVKIRREDFF